MDRLIKGSGGDLRDLMLLLKGVLVSLEDESVTDSLIREVENRMRRDRIMLPKDYRQWLAQIHKTKHHGLEEMRDLHHLAHFFDTNLVQCYHNGSDWYDVHPLLRTSFD